MAILESMPDETMKKIEEAIIPGIHIALDHLGKVMAEAEKKGTLRKGALDDILAKFQHEAGENKGEETDEGKSEEDDG